MAYTTNPNMAKVRRDAVNLVKYRKWSMRKVALRFGVEPSTISRWCQLPFATGWHELPTRSSRPKTSPTALKKEIVIAIIAKRVGRRRCGQHIYHELRKEGVKVSLPSVQRTLDRCRLLKKRSPWKRPHDATPRPEVLYAGALLQADTIHILAPDGSRIYVYTLLDMIQTDLGSEFSTWFTHGLWSRGIKHRHSRVRQSNDNAHVERFNRTLQEECLDRAPHTITDFGKVLPGYLDYYNNARTHMGINYQVPNQLIPRC